jgi:hypothetical protein
VCCREKACNLWVHCSAIHMKMDAQRMLDSMLAGEDSDSEGSDYTTEEADRAQDLVMHRRGSAPAVAQWLKADGNVKPARRSKSFEPQDWRKVTDGAMMTQEGKESKPGRNVLPELSISAKRRSVSFGATPAKVRQTARTCTHTR